MKTIDFKSTKIINLSSIRDLFDVSDEWELCAWPISYNESISFIFRNLNDGDVLTDGSDKNYRFKVFTVSDFDFSNTQKRDVELFGVSLVSIYYWQGGYAYAVRDKQDVYSVIFYDDNGSGEKIISKVVLGPNVSRLTLTKDGRIVFGYAGTFPDVFPCFTVLSSTGNTIYECREDSARACMDLTVDGDDNIWASCYPDTSIYEVKKNGAIVSHKYPVASPDGLIPFRMNGKMATILSYSNDEVYVPFNCLHVDDKLYEVCFDDLHPSNIDGISAYADLVVIRTIDDELHFFKLDKVAKMLEDYASLDTLKSK